MGRIIIFTGKGGVGKSSVAAAHAVRSASEGVKTLLVSADMAHNLGDIFQVNVGGKGIDVSENLSLLELDPEMLMREEFPEANKAIAELYSSAGFALSGADEGFMIPGFENLFSLLKIGQIYNSGRYERIFVDCAPTGETLSLLKLPELLAWYMEKFFPVGKFITRVMAPISKARFRVKLPERKAMDQIEEMHAKLLELQELLKNDEICTLRLVCTPEKMVVEETKRNYMYLNLFSYRADGLFINRILPEEADNAFLQNWRNIQKGYIEELERVFNTMPITKIPWYPVEVRGEDAVQKLAEDILAEEDIFDVRVHTENETYEEIEGGYCLVLGIPGAPEGSLHVTSHRTDVDIRLNNFVRCIPLPNVLADAEMTGTEYRDGILRIKYKLREGENL